MAESSQRIDAWRRIAAATIVGIAAVRACVAIVPQVRFDVDPASDPAGYAGFGPTGSLAFDVLLLAASATAIVLELAAGRRIIRWLVVAAALPGLAVLAHGIDDARDLFRGSTWLAAAFAAVAALHLARDPALRRLLVAGSLAVAAPMLLRGAEQILLEHPATVAFFEANRPQILAERGWAPGSPAAEGFERRLRQAEAVGWLGLANLFSSVMAFGAIGFAACAVVARPRGVASLLCAALALGCAALLVVNGSKGAVGAAALGLAVACIGVRFGRGVAGWAAIAAIALAASAPALRGLFDESAFGGERSLLFRSHYLAGAFGMASEAWPFGVGPDGFQDAYLRAKPARSPEDVTSAHAAFVDWLVLLGPLGIAWIALTLRLVVGWPRSDEGADERDERMDGRTPVVIAAILALALLAALSLAEESIADARWVLSRGGAAILFGLTFVAALRVLGRGGARLEPWLWGAIVAVLAQAQIEMILFQPGLSVWLMVALGAIAGPPSRATAEPLPGAGGPRPLDAVPIALPAAAAMAILAFGLVPQWQQDRLLDRAAAEVAPLARIRDAWRTGWSEEVLRAASDGPTTKAMLSLVRETGGVELEAMLRSALASGATPQERGEAVRRALQRFDGGQRAKAADLLRAADEVHPTNPVALESAVKQLAAAGRRTLGTRRPDIVDPALHAAAIELAALLDQREGTARSAAMLADLWLERTRATPDAATLDATEAAVRAALERQPRGWGRWVDLGDALAVRERFAEASEAYATALAIDDDLELDPLVRMTPGVRATTVARRDAARIAAEGGAKPPAGWPLR